MATQRTPPKSDVNKYPSNPEIPTAVAKEYANINTRKRKQFDECNPMSQLEIRFEQQLTTWDNKITETINRSITTDITSALTQELSKITTALSDLNSNVSNLNKETLNIKNSVSEMGTRIQEIENSLDFASEKQASLENKIKEIEYKISPITTLSTDFEGVKQKLLVMEQQARSCNIEISNLPERRGENLLTQLEKLFNAIKHPLNASDIVSVHRVPHADQKSSSPKNIIVKLPTSIMRDNLIAAYRAAKGLTSTQLSIAGPAHRIYINEHLTLNNKHLFRQTRENAKKHNFKYVWVKNGTIFARKTDYCYSFTTRYR
ncbi:unnamed protein product [Leptidea sinapis]|uniref:FP protein C-terminal domain-containing protein n=1 Tax=Leptidea sinapis TaxID=189913 RepID=A0A5E4R2L2_9NEOP|nr:unnamed protein product [Leptidea sinapis]